VELISPLSRRESGTARRAMRENDAEEHTEQITRITADWSKTRCFDGERGLDLRIATGALP